MREIMEGKKKALATIIETMKKNMGSFRNKQEFIGIIHGDCENEAMNLKNMIKKEFGFENFVIEPIGPSIGAHSGPGTLGVMFLGETR